MRLSCIWVSHVCCCLWLLRTFVYWQSIASTANFAVTFCAVKQKPGYISRASSSRRVYHPYHSAVVGGYG